MGGGGLSRFVARVKSWNARICRTDAGTSLNMLEHRKCSGVPACSVFRILADAKSCDVQTSNLDINLFWTKVHKYGVC